MARTSHIPSTAARRPLDPQGQGSAAAPGATAPGTLKHELQNLVGALKDCRRKNQFPNIDGSEHLAVLCEHQNRKIPGLRLRLLPAEEGVLQAVADELVRVRGGGQKLPQWQAVLATSVHRSAVSVLHARDDPDRVSAVFLDSVQHPPDFQYLPSSWAQHRQERQQYREKIGRQLEGSGLKMSFVSVETGVQTDHQGCSVFAIDACRQMFESKEIRRLHDRLLTTETDIGTGLVGTLVEGAVPSNFSLEMPFFVHSQSRGKLTAVIDSHPDWKSLPVRDDKTLLEWSDVYRTVRIGFVERRDQNPPALVFGTSIEDERIWQYEEVLRGGHPGLDLAPAPVRSSCGFESLFSDPAPRPNAPDRTFIDSINRLSDAANQVLGKRLNRANGDGQAQKIPDFPAQDVNIQDASGNSLAHLFCRVLDNDKALAVLGGDLEGLFRWLARAGLKLDRRNRQGETPLSLARFLGNKAAVDALTKLGAEDCGAGGGTHSAAMTTLSQTGSVLGKRSMREAGLPERD